MDGVIVDDGDGDGVTVISVEDGEDGGGVTVLSVIIAWLVDSKEVDTFCLFLSLSIVYVSKLEFIGWIRAFCSSEIVDMIRL